MSLSTTAPTIAGIVEALERDAEELAKIRHNARLDFSSIRLQTDKVAIHATRHLLASATTDGSPFVWLNGNKTGWETWDAFNGGLSLRPDQLAGKGDLELVKLLEFPITSYLLNKFPLDDEGMIEYEWPPNDPAPQTTDLDREQIRNRTLESACRNAAALLLAHYDP